MSLKERVVILASGKGTLIEFVSNFCKLYRKDIVVVSIGSDRYSKLLLQKSNIFKIPSFVIDYKDYEYEQWNEAMANTINLYKPTIILFLGFMRIVNAKFIEKFNNSVELINIHPSLLPKYKGIKAIEKAIENKEKYIGSTIHRVVEELDSGEIIDQIQIKATSYDLVYLREKLFSVEKELIYRYLIKKLQ